MTLLPDVGCVGWLSSYIARQLSLHNAIGWVFLPPPVHAMAGEIVYADLNLPGARLSPSSKAHRNVLESPQCPRWHGVVLKVGGAGVIILLVMVAVLSAWVFQGFSNKGPALKSDGVTQGTRSGRECNAGLEDFFFRLKQSLCDPAQISSAGGSGCKLCPTEWMLHRDKCFWLSKETKAWNESRDDCSRKGSQMLVLQDWEQMDYLQPLIPAGQSVWIGLTFNSSQRKWTWADGAPVSEELVPGLSQAEANSCGHLGMSKTEFEICSSELKWLCQKAAFLV
ncbi:killer cell lectin-like receptor subfamily B member 1B allele B isoform X2 [Chelonia mydas]|uniref:killer cell lectin-like receptor subfamily B member 1B allele B isoform X2 n=1 Tax=Chelonia mydas TaxID=8469 RepID=UPI0018A1FC21|nr:killer cell lectin-like receptor subfamily B member 1B allele B isoform X2 [Chelonia mydas]